MLSGCVSGKLHSVARGRAANLLHCFAVTNNNVTMTNNSGKLANG